jgi:hypothetical protein
MALFERKPSGAEALLSERAVFFSSYDFSCISMVWFPVLFLEGNRIPFFR